MRVSNREDAMELNEKVMILMVMASEKFKKKSSAILRRHGLTFSHYCVLKSLVACEHGRDTVGNVSKKMLVSAPNITGIAKRMEKAGLIERKNDARDERLIMLQVTPSGRETLGAMGEIQEQHCLAYLEIYSPKQKEEVLSVLKHIVREVKHLPNSFS
jgi:DNA-binding MarR family transcriptional regulator